MPPESGAGAAPESGAAHFPYAAVLWDMDGTLVDSEPVHRRSFLEACAALGIALPDDFHDRLVGQSEEAIHRDLAESFGLTEPLSRWSQRRFSAYLARISEVRAHGVAQELWQAVAGIGVRQAIVSNAPRRIVEANAARFGLAPGAVLSVAREDVARGKPHPDPYLRAAAQLGVAPAAVAVVEDSLSGLQSARAAGMSVFMMPGFDGGAGLDWQPVDALQRAVRQGVPA